MINCEEENDNTPDQGRIAFCLHNEIWTFTRNIQFICQHKNELINVFSTLNVFIKKKSIIISLNTFFPIKIIYIFYHIRYYVLYYINHLIVPKQYSIIIQIKPNCVRFLLILSWSSARLSDSC